MKTRLLICAFIVFFTGTLSAHESNHWNSMAVRAANSGQMDFAFMYYRSFLAENSVNTPKRQSALFAVAEYYYLNSDFNQSSEHFQDYLNSSTDKVGMLFAQYYLWHIAQLGHQELRAKQYEQRIKTMLTHAFIFDEVKEYVFLSPLKRAHKARYSIQKVEFYIEDKLAAEIQY